MKILNIMFMAVDGELAFITQEQERPGTPGLSSYVHTGIAEEKGPILTLKLGSTVFWLLPASLLPTPLYLEMLGHVREAQEKLKEDIEAEMAFPKMDVDPKANMDLVTMAFRRMVEAGLDASMSAAQRMPSGELAVVKYTKEDLMGLAFPELALGVRH